MRLGETFTDFDIDVSYGITIHGTQGGHGPALLLLHGFPQNHLIWHKVAPQLSQSYTVVALDLRGFGTSSKPGGEDPKHVQYSKSTMAGDCAAVMKRLGHEKYFVCGHDRGGRVAHKLCVEYPERVLKVMFLDIIPTLAHYETTDQFFATTYWHWFFLIQDAPFPENLILGAPEVSAQKFFRNMLDDVTVFHSEAASEYRSLFTDPAGVHAMCEDYRAAATIDLEEQREDIEKKRKIICPIRVFWGAKGLIEMKYDAVTEWRKVCCNTDVGGGSFPGGHYIPEEADGELLVEIQKFFI
ncbi:putative hydrolase or acyltransferase of alpha/beta superfamily [Patellaria atrata CBS 101060]|uniref:Hydrolase or acyltransferase of alpha/beta superfamily n=1 Tax=Patellaria atrata CBS 101060 TaxID=1346257 RepID=A0A9P4VSB1_9PEZI|nr:putative hydrolase or acyltransferase of alpha/beta superfamily [Patellaria atrata CBS 101060]